ncbi:hypothetical protein LTR70_009694 [Exophiala xenobiotica]|nr:hypothetical protein LTR70_009694 [Exophiala xenobiotica]
MASQLHTGTWPTAKDRQLAWALPPRERVQSRIQPHPPLVHEPPQHNPPTAKRRRRESIDPRRQDLYYTQHYDGTPDDDDDDDDDLDVSVDELQHDLASSPEHNAGDHDTSNLFEYDPDVGLDDTHESFGADGQNSDNYDTAVEAVEGVVGVEEGEHEGSDSDEDEDDDKPSTSVENNEASIQAGTQQGSSSATSGIDDEQDQEKYVMKSLPGAESSSEWHNEPEHGITTATATTTVPARRDSEIPESEDEDPTTITVRVPQAEGQPVERSSGTFDFEIDDNSPIPSTSTPYTILKQSWTEESDWDQFKQVKNIGSIKVGGFASIALSEKKYKSNPPTAKIIDIRRGSTKARQTWVVIQWPYLVSEAVDVLKQAGHKNAQRLVEGWPSRTMLLSDVYQILPANAILKKVVPNKINGEKMFTLRLEEGLNGRDKPGAAVVDAPRKSRKNT